MKPFENVSKLGNEKAFRFGPLVPEDGINLAYIKSAKLTPQNNVVIIDTSRITDENTNTETSSKQIFFANERGVLVDEDGNAAITDQYPYVTDVFNVDEDWRKVPGSEYTSKSMLPFVHVSRHFHLDDIGLIRPGELRSYRNGLVKVVDSQGREYVDSQGRPRYRTMIAVAQVDPDSVEETSVWAYRVWAFVDTQDNEDLYLTYSKVEVRESGKLEGRQTGYRELLNPLPVFSFNPEEADVVDPRNRYERQYSTKPIVSGNRSNIGSLVNATEGYEVYVPRKAIEDKRIYQLFRWRINCTFINDDDIDVARDLNQIKAGLVCTTIDMASEKPTRAPWALLNLENSQYNVRNIRFINPLKEEHSDTARQQLDYWLVNIDTDDLNDFDLLIWAPNRASFNVSSYSAKIDHFVRVNGGTLLFDTNNYVDINDTFTATASHAVVPTSGQPRNLGFHEYESSVDVFTTVVGSTDKHPLIDGAELVGGWDLRETENNNELQTSMSYAQLRPLLQSDPRYCQNFAPNPDGYEVVLKAKQSTSSSLLPVTVAAKLGHGYKIVSTFAQTLMCSTLLNPSNGTVLNANAGRTLVKVPEYQNSVSSTFVEGAMKFLYNVALVAVQGRALSEVNEDFFSSRWTYSTEWHPSWVINGLDDDVLDDKEKSDYNFFQQERDLLAEEPDNVFVWKRQLSHLTVEEFTNQDMAPLLQNPVFASRIEGANRHYVIEVTNPNVKTTSFSLGSEYPSAWTEVYSPRFEIPDDFGPHAIREEVDESGVAGRLATLDKNVKYKQVQYPPKPYAGQVTASFISSEEKTVTQTGTYSAQVQMRVKYAHEVIPPPAPNPPPEVIDGEVTLEVEWSWYDAWGGSDSSAFAQLVMDNTLPNIGERVPRTIKSWSEEVYNSSIYTSHLYPFWGFSGVLSVTPFIRPESALSEHIKLVQDAMNRFHRLGYFPGKILSINGKYDNNVAAVVRDFQRTFQARKQDGNVDAETWFIIGSQIERARHEGRFNSSGSPPGPISPSDTTYQGLFLRSSWLDRRRISDGRSDTWILRRSDSQTGPSIIWDIFAITFPDTSTFRNKEWYAIRVVPYVPGNVNTMKIDMVGVEKGNWTPQTYQMPSNPGHFVRPTDGVTLSNLNSTVYSDKKRDFILPRGTKGNTFVVGASQGARAGDHWGPTGRVLGFKNIFAVTKEKRSLNTGTYHYHGSLRHRHGPYIPHSHAGGPSSSLNPGQGSAPLQMGYESVEHWEEEHGYLEEDRKKIFGLGPLGDTIIFTRPVGDGGSGTSGGTSKDVNTHYHGTMSHQHGWNWVPGHQHGGGPPATGSQASSGNHFHGDRTTGHNHAGGDKLHNHGNGELSTTQPGVSSITPHYHGPFLHRHSPATAGHIHPGSSQAATNEPVGTVPGQEPTEPIIVYEEKDVVVNVTGSVSVGSFETKKIQLSYPNPGKNAEVLSAAWRTITVNNPAITAQITTNGLATFTNQTAELELGSGTTRGASFPGGQVFYSMDRNRVIDPIPEVGLVSKSENLKLLCTVSGKPFGFPSLPTDAGASEAAYHYATLRIESLGSHSSVTLGFYDINDKEFVTSPEGEPEISYIEYIKRGPDNVYIAVTADYEEVTEKIVPNDVDAIAVPHKWAMPVYGVQFRGGSHISLQPLPPTLDYTDIWPISVRDGSFHRRVTIRPKTSGPLTSYLKDYHGKTLTAFYGLPEAEMLLPYSELYGRPYVEVMNEQPEILDDNVIRIRQTPIAAIQQPTVFYSYADPVRPLMKVFTRENIHSSSWTEIPIYNISDYNLSTGEIFLRNKLTSNDPRLLKVDYFTTQPHFALKRFDKHLLNLNAYSEFGQELIGKPIYIYLVPRYVRDQDNNVIPASLQKRALRVAFSPDIFDYFSPNYDPLAVQLGVVYLSTALRPEEVVVLDTRRRGGGIKDSANLAELARIVQETSMYWDVNYAAGMSYPKSGYAVIRLPRELENDFTEQQIRSIIERNITAGVAFKVEDLDGNDWS